MCETYPTVLGVPAAVSDEMLGVVAQFRSKGRLPVREIYFPPSLSLPLPPSSLPPSSLPPSFPSSLPPSLPHCFSLPPSLPPSPSLPLPPSQTLSWLHPVTHASITRSSQPLVGAGRKRSKEDEEYLAAILKANKHSKKLFVMDARPKINAYANIVSMGGGGGGGGGREE